MTHRSTHIPGDVSLIGMASLNAFQLDTLHDIYLEAFPPEERRPWDDIAGDRGPRLLAIVADGKPAGLLTHWRLGTFEYIEHLAVDSALRSAGIGSVALDMFVAAAGMPVVLEVEKPASSVIAARRVGFYSRHGFRVISTTYIQPPYAPGLPEVPLDLMSTDPRLCPDEVSRALHHRVYQRFNIS